MRMARTEAQAACMAVTSADILLQRACILPFLKMQKLARKGGCVKSLCSILRDAACERVHMSQGTRGHAVGAEEDGCGFIVHQREGAT